MLSYDDILPSSNLVMCCQFMHEIMKFKNKKANKKSKQKNLKKAQKKRRRIKMK